MALFDRSLSLSSELERVLGSPTASSALDSDMSMRFEFRIRIRPIRNLTGASGWNQAFSVRKALVELTSCRQSAHKELRCSQTGMNRFSFSGTVRAMVLPLSRSQACVGLRVRRGLSSFDIDSFWQAPSENANWNASDILERIDGLHAPIRLAFEELITDRLRNEVLRHG